MEYKVGVISGDGIGPEIVTEAKKVLDKIADKYGHKFNYTEILMGGCSIDATGVPLTDEAIETAQASDAVLMGSMKHKKRQKFFVSFDRLKVFKTLYKQIRKRFTQRRFVYKINNENV